MIGPLTEERAAGLARIALGHVTREYPNKPGHVLAGPEDARTPAALHPVFFGSFDWHSCVHSYWLLARVLRLFPSCPEAAAIAGLFDQQLRPQKVGGECAYFERPTARGFERPYGWAWLLKLAAELERLPEPRWAAAVAPLADLLCRRFAVFLGVAPGPVRAGAHANTAFALRLAADAADAYHLKELIRDKVATWFLGDEPCPAWGEPDAEDFLSPTLIEAECVRRVLPDRFAPWFGRFLPQLEYGRPTTLFRPALPTDRSDGKIAHLDGLNLSRAWCFRALAAALPGTDARAEVMRQAASRHLEASLPHLASDYMGEHWLATYVLLALSEPEQGPGQEGA